MQREPYDPSHGRGQQGSLRQLPDGRWRARYRENGRQGRRPQATFPTREQAATWLRDKTAEAVRVRGGDRGPIVPHQHRATTCSEGATRYLDTLDIAALSRKTTERRLRAFTSVFGPRLMQSLEPQELEAWRLTLTPGWRAHVFQDVRRMCEAWRRWHWITGNPTDGVRNRAARAAEVTPIPWQHLLWLEDEIDERYLIAPILAGGTGLRPEEFLALEWRDVDLSERVLYVSRVCSGGRVIDLGADGSKTHRQRRRVPLREAVVERLENWPRQLHTRLLLPAPEGGHMGQHQFRERFWRPAFTCAGVPYQRPYDMRHTYASESIAAGVNLFDLSRFMGTSLKQIDRTYGHLVADSHQRNRELLDTYDQARAAEA